MGIKFTKAYVANGKTYATLEEAQVAELEALFKDGEGASGPPWEPLGIAERILATQDAIIDILTTTANSRPLARKANGGSKSRKPKQPELIEASETGA